MFLWASAAASFLTFLIHTFIGGRAVARPLLADESLPKASKWLNYYCWHITTFLLLFMSIALALLAASGTGPSLRAVFLFNAVFCAVLSALSAWVALKGKIKPLRFPSTSLFALIAAFCAAAAFRL